MTEPAPLFFKDAAAFRRWLLRHHQTATEAWLGFHRKGLGPPSLSYDTAVEVALCFGWIDGVRRKLDDTRYVNRFTPRKPGSNWSLVNIARVERLTAAGQMHPSGVAAFERRTPTRIGVYSFEQRPDQFPRELERRFKASPAAWRHFGAQPPGYRRMAIWWVSSAKREETRERRLGQLIDASSRGERLGVLFGQVPARTAKERS